MRAMTNILWAATLLMMLGLTSCYELQSDEELREDIIGTWESEYCKYPYTNNPEDATTESPMRSIMTFYPDGRFVEGGSDPYCVPDSCGSYGYCTCTWQIENGNLSIHTDGNTAGYGRIRIDYPIFCLQKERMVFDNTRLNDITLRKACYHRK